MSTGSEVVDPEDALDSLVEHGVLLEAADGTLSTTTAFESTRGVYYDTYVDVSDEDFHAAVADVFGVSVEDAAAYLEANDISREEFVAYLSLQSFLEQPPARETLGVMARIVLEVGPGTPVPEPIEVVDDDTFEEFLDDNPDAILTVWRHYCQPCLAMKDDLDALLQLVPDGVAVAGLDGEDSPRFRLEHGVNAAPAVLCFRDGEAVRVETGRATPAVFEEYVTDVYGSDAASTADTEPND